MAWPHCLTEAETLAQMLAGKSIARFGDGELAIALGSGNSTHKADVKIRAEFMAILHDPAPGCLPAIPTMDPKSPRIENWLRYRISFARALDMKRTYGSALVGQSLSAPWVDTDEHVLGFRSLWKGKRAVAVVPERDQNLQKVLRWDASEVLDVFCPEVEAYSAIDDIEAACVALRPEIVVACAGPMATALANRLAARGIHCIDLGRGLGLILRHVYKGAE